MADAQMLSKVDGVNKNLAAIVKALTTAFVGQAAVGVFTMAAAATKTVTRQICSTLFQFRCFSVCSCGILMCKRSRFM